MKTSIFTGAGRCVAIIDRVNRSGIARRTRIPPDTHAFFVLDADTICHTTADVDRLRRRADRDNNFIAWQWFIDEKSNSRLRDIDTLHLIEHRLVR